MPALKYLIFLLVPTLAFASNKPEPPDDPPIEQTVEQSQTQDMEQQQEQIQTQTFTGGANTSSAQSGDVSLQGGDVSISNRRQYRRTPNVYAPPVQPTVSCFKGASLSVGALGNALALGAGKIDKGCVRRELIRLAPESHKLYLFCKEPTVTEMFDGFENCMKHEEVMPDARDSRSELPTYDDAALTQQIEALVARVGAVEDDSKQTKVRARARARSAPPDPYKAMQARVLAQTEYYE